MFRRGTLLWLIIALVSASCQWQPFVHCFVDQDCPPTQRCTQGQCTSPDKERHTESPPQKEALPNETRAEPHTIEDTEKHPTDASTPPEEPSQRTRACYTGKNGCLYDTNTKQYTCKGRCRTGTQQLNAGRDGWGACLDQVTSQEEQCNGQDDDCNGIIDDPCQTLTQKRVFPYHDLHLGPVHASAISPKGQWLATADAHGVIKIWDATKQAFVRSLRHHKTDVYALTFHPTLDPPVLLSGSADGELMIWDIQKKTPLHIIKAHTSKLYALAVHPDGLSFASGAEKGVLQLWDWQTHTRKRLLVGHTDTIYGVSFHPDKQTLLSASKDGTVRRWKLSDGTLHKTYTLQDANKAPLSARTLAVHPDGKMFAVGTTAREVLLGRLDRDEPLKRLSGHSGVIYAAAWLPQSQLLITGGTTPAFQKKDEIRIWDTSNQTALTTCLDTSAPQVLSIATSSSLGQTTFITTANEKSVQWWRWDNQQRKCTQQMAHTHDGKQLHLRGILSLAIKPGSLSTVFTGSDSGQIHAWELSSETTLSVLKGHTKGVCTLSLSPTGTLLASGSYDNTVLLWDTSTFQPLNTTLDNLKHNGRLFSVVFSADGKYLATASEGMKESVRVIEIQSQRVVQKMDTRQRSPVGVHFLEGDQKLMAIASDGEVFLWDRNGTLLSSKKLFTSPSFHITTTTLHQTTLAVGTSTGMVTTFRLPDFQTIRSYTGKVSARITRIQFHPTKQQLIASQLEGSIVLWDLTTGRLQDVVFGHSRGTMDIVYAADGKQLYATGGDLQVSEWTYLRNPGG